MSTIENMSVVVDKNLKIVVVGDGGTGKTVLLWCYTGKEYRPEYVPTVLENFITTVTFGQNKIGLEIHDTAGQEDFVNIRQIVYPGTDVFIMCYSTVLHQSLQNIKVFWLPETRVLMPEAPFVLVGNKLDLKDTINSDEYVEPSYGQRLIDENNGYAHFQCSAKLESMDNPPTQVVSEIFKQAMICGIRQRIPDPDPKPYCCFL